MTAVDLLQSMLLIVLLIFVVGLTRQIAFFVRPPSAQRAEPYGPQIGDRLPAELLGTDERSQLRTLISASSVDQAAILVVNEQCDPCETWLELLEAADREMPLITITKDPSRSFTSRLIALSDVLVRDDDHSRLQKSNLVATPFVMVVDHNLRVQQKQLGGDPTSILGLAPPDSATVNLARRRIAVISSTQRGTHREEASHHP